SIPAPPGPADLVERVIVVPGKRLEGQAPFPTQPGVISVIIFPKPTNPTEVELHPSEELLEKVRHFLDRRRLITTRVHVMGRSYMRVSLEVETVREARTDAQQVRSQIDQRIRQFFHPLTGGEQENGWPIGRSVYKSELFQLIEAVEGVDHVNKIVMNGNPA